MKTTYQTRWGNDIVSVTADWSQASCPVEGDSRGRQVADFRHNWSRALRAALEDCAQSEGMDPDTAADAVEAALADAERVE